MGSVKVDPGGRQHHWMDSVGKFYAKTIPKKMPKQKRSLKGQQPLFPDVPIDHLKPKDEK